MYHDWKQLPARFALRAKMKIFCKTRRLFCSTMDRLGGGEGETRNENRLL